MTEQIPPNVSDNLGISISDQDLLAKLTDTENTFIERKTVSDSKGWLKTAVAFANSCPIGYPAFLFVGVNDDGTIQRHGNQVNFEEKQKEVSARIGSAWPPIYHLIKTLRKDAGEFLAVIVPGSAQRPHFSGPSYVRIGPETREASEKQYEELIAQRSSKVRELQKLIGQTVLWQSLAPFTGNADGRVAACNQFFLTIHGAGYKRCFPVDWITISFEPNDQRYHLIVQN
jgi:Putative DNA-binding domain